MTTTSIEDSKTTAARMESQLFHIVEWIHAINARPATTMGELVIQDAYDYIKHLNPFPYRSASPNRTWVYLPSGITGIPDILLNGVTARADSAVMIGQFSSYEFDGTVPETEVQLSNLGTFLASLIYTHWVSRFPDTDHGRAMQYCAAVHALGVARTEYDQAVIVHGEHYLKIIQPHNPSEATKAAFWASHAQVRKLADRWVAAHLKTVKLSESPSFLAVDLEH